MKLPGIIILALFPLNIILGQDTNHRYHRTYPNNDIYIEFVGSGINFGTLNYERKIIHKNFFYFSLRTGIGYGVWGATPEIISAPFLVNGIFQVYHSLAGEIGIGGCFIYYRSQKDQNDKSKGWVYNREVIPTALIGIRVQGKKGFLFRATYTPLYAYGIIIPSFGISFGYSFGKKKQ